MLKNVKWRLGGRKGEKRRRAPLAIAVQNIAGVGLVHGKYVRLLTSAATRLAGPCVRPRRIVENIFQKSSNEGSLVRFRPLPSAFVRFCPLGCGGAGGGNVEFGAKDSKTIKLPSEWVRWSAFARVCPALPAFLWGGGRNS